MRHTTAAIIAILVIVGIVFEFTGGFSGTSTLLSGNLGGAAIATGNDGVTAGLPPTPVQPVGTVSLVANSGFINTYDTLTLTSDNIMFPAGTAQTLTIELRGSEAEDVQFRVQHTATADSFAPRGGTILVTKRGPTNGAYAAITAADLNALRTTQGPGWYVFTAQDGAGNPHALPLFIR